MNHLLYVTYQKSIAYTMKQMAKRACRRGEIDKKWKGFLLQAAEEKPSIHTYYMMKAFLNDSIVLERLALTDNDINSPAVICVEKNSLTYMKKFLPYYRNLGVGLFIIIDNESTDGTREYLMEQEDVTLYTAPYAFEHRRKSGWLLQALQKSNISRWYLRLDADEFFSWKGMEESSLQDLIRKMESHHMGALRAIMVDMYPSYSLMDGKHDDEQFIEDFAYFDDASSYHTVPETDEIFGGMRKRTTGADMRVDKYVIFRPDRGYIPLTSHNMTGIHNDEERKVRGILRHYKFLPSESEKYRNISENKNSGYSGFKNVSKYGKLVDGHISALSEHSIRYESSDSIQKLDLIESL